MRRLMVAVVALVPVLSFAGSARVNVAMAADSLEIASGLARASPRECQANVVRGLDQAMEDLDAYKKLTDERLDRVRISVVGLGAIANASRCHPEVQGNVERAASLVAAAIEDLKRPPMARPDRPGVIPAPPRPGPPPMPPPPQPPVVARDCGTGGDPGCQMNRNGGWPMDGDSFRGFLTALKANNNELTRRDMVADVMAREFVTARQLGLVLDLFRNELTRLEVARLMLPHTVNPMAALGHSAKWQNSISAREYTELVTAQR